MVVGVSEGFSKELEIIGTGYRATINGLKSLKRPDEVARLRGLSAEEFVPKGLLEAYTATEKGGVPGTPHPQPGDTGAS